MIDFESVMDRLKHFFEVPNDKEVADILGISPSSIYERRKRGSIPFEQIISTLDNKQVDLDWIFYGIESKEEKPRTAFIQYYSDISSSGGNGSIDLLGPYEMIQIDIGLFQNADIKNVIAVKMNSNSMSPTISSQDTIFVDRSKTDIEDGKAYMVNINGEINIKRIFKLHSGLVVRSDNKNYPIEEVGIGSVNIIAKVIYKMEYIG